MERERDVAHCVCASVCVRSRVRVGCVTSVCVCVRVAGSVACKRILYLPVDA